MPTEDYDARALALPVDEPPPEPRNFNQPQPAWQRPRSGGSFSSNTPKTYTARAMYAARQVNERAAKLWARLTPVQRVLVVIAGLTSFITGILFMIYNVQILGFITPYAKKWRELTGGWLILWALFFTVSFPPLIGYSTLLTITGIVYGVPKGWLIAASATTIGSTASFLVSRHYLRNYTERLVSRDSRFAALALVLKHDGLKLLVMIRLCPLPYSLSNGALATVPTINWPTFMLATAIGSLKLFLHIFVGAKLGEIGERGEKMDTRTKLVSYFSIAVGVIVGAGTGIFMYRQTKRRADELAAQEREGVRRPSVDALRSEYADDPSALEAAETLREHSDDISLHTEEAYEDWDDYDDDPLPPANDRYTDSADSGAGRAPLADPDVFATGDASDDDGRGK